MKNYYEELFDNITIFVDGENKYGLKVGVDLDDFDKVKDAIDGYWHLANYNGNNKIIGYKNNEVILLSKLIGEIALEKEFEDKQNIDNVMYQKFDTSDITQKTLYEIINHENLDCQDTIKNAKEEFYQYYKDYIDNSLKNKLNKRFSSLLEQQKDLIQKYESGKLSGKELYTQGNVSIEDIYYKELCELELYNTSEILLPGHEMVLYKNIKERKAMKDVTCMYSGSIIKRGSYYILYRPFIEDLTTGFCYTISIPIKCDPCYIDMLPDNIKSLEDLSTKMSSAYDYNDNDMYDFVTNYGSDGISLKKIGR